MPPLLQPRRAWSHVHLNGKYEPVHIAAQMLPGLRKQPADPHIGLPMLRDRKPRRQPDAFVPRTAIGAKSRRLKNSLCVYAKIGFAHLGLQARKFPDERTWRSQQVT